MAGRINCLCIDNSPHSLAAFEWYTRNLHRESDVVGLIHVYQMPQLPSLGLMAGSIPITDDYRTSINNSFEESKKLIKDYTDRCKQNNMEFKVMEAQSHHSPGQTICDIAKENHVSAIILGQRGLSKFSRALLGSTSDYVLHHSDVTVVVVPPEDRQ